MAPKRKAGSRKAAASKNKHPTEDLKKQESPESPASAEAVEAAEVDQKNAENEPSPKKAKVEGKKKPGRKPKADSKKAVGSKKKNTDDDEKKDEEDASEEEEPHSADAGKVVIIEASKECNCFKTRAAKVQTGLSEAFPGIEVLINPEKPRKGCFEVRGKEGNVYFSMLGMPRPFTKLKNVDMDKAIEDIVAKVK